MTGERPPPACLDPAVVAVAAAARLGLQLFDGELRLVWRNAIEAARPGAPAIGAAAAEIYGDPAAHDAFTAARRERATCFVEWPLPGGTLALELALEPVAHDGASYVRVLTMDRTAERDAERLRKILDVTDDPIVQYDQEWRYVYANAGACRLLGRRADELVGRRIWDLSPHSVGGEYHHALHAAHTRGETVRFESFDTTDGRWYATAMFPVRDGVVVYSNDVSARRKATDDLVDADRRKDEFLATLAHELRNPLAPIRNATAYLRRVGSPEPEIVRAWNIIDRQVAGMARLVEDLLDVSRLTFGRYTLRREPTPLARVLSNAVEATMPQLEAAHHTVTVTLPPEELLVDGDSARLTQVFVNLLNNAARYTPEHGRIMIESEWTADQVTIRVRDTGIGIAPDMQPYVFDLFTQVNRRYDSPRGGLGIGLTLARQLTELHDGQISVRSDGPGLGTEFTVRLPRLAAAVEAHSPSAAAPATPRRVLLVDDDADLTESLAAYLELFGHLTQVLATGAQVEEVVARFRPDVIVLDIGLPDVDGYALATRLRAAGVRVPIVALTGWGSEQDKAKSLAAGFDLHLTKPVEPDQILAVLAAGGKDWRS